MRTLSSILCLLALSLSSLIVLSQSPCSAPINLSEGKATQQSSMKATGHSALAVDGILTGGDPWRGEIQHTQKEYQPWWQVDLGELAQLSEITIYNRINCCQSRLQDFVVLLSEQAFPPDASVEELEDLDHIEVLASPGLTQAQYRFTTEAMARYIRIQLRGRNSLHMAEVVVRGCVPPEPAPEAEERNSPPIDSSPNLQSLLNCTEANPASVDPIYPSQDQNYIRTTLYRTSGSVNVPESDKIQSLTYYDGLGRPIQEIDAQGTPDGKDLLTHIEYDGYGRRERSYLPFSPQVSSSSAPGSYREIGNPELASNSYYKSLPSLGYLQRDPMAWVDTEYEPSPLNRVIEQGAPGAEWQPVAVPGQQGSGEHTRVMEYRTNTHSVPGFDPLSLDAAAIPLNPHFYPPNSLSVLRSYDENGGLTESATDKLGRTIYKSVQTGKSFRLSPIQSDSFATTYFVYDLHSNVRYVIQPEGWKKARSQGLSLTLLRNFCFQYLYDDRQRVRRKRIPGSDWEDLVYDELDRVVATQDGMLRQKGHWLITKYDYLGRPVKTGICTHLESREELEELISYNPRPYESLQDSKQDYSSYLDPQIDEVYSLTFYDNYDFLPDDSFDFQSESQLGFLSQPSDKAEPYRKALHNKGRVTGVRIFVLNPSPDIPESLLTVTYYDKYGREIQTIAENHLGGKELVANRYNFIGELLESLQFHHWKAPEQQRIHKAYRYDHRGRLKQSLQQINSDPAVVLLDQQYDELGHLAEKNLGMSACVSPLQSIDYQYNIRGWLTGINTLSGPTEDPSEDWFQLRLGYTDGDHPMYNGNISSLSWKYGFGNSSWRHYQYRYDQQNRLVEADYRGPGGEDYDVPSIRYDLNGNILNLHRKGKLGRYHYGDLDKLSYTYSGNRLLFLRDNAQRNILEDIDHFATRSNGSPYRYDANGNISYDPHKGITYTYNHLNKPIRAQFRNNSFINWIYSADGTKLQEHYSGDSSATHDYVGGFFYMQRGSEPRQLLHIAHEEGRALKIGEQFRYEYNLKDHLGNIRLSFSDKNGDGQIGSDEVLSGDSYYPFGMRMGGLSLARGTENRFRYNGKEWHKELGLGLYDYGFRWYDPAVGRFPSVDPLAEKFTHYTPFQYAGNKPIKFIDLDGLEEAHPQEVPESKETNSQQSIWVTFREQAAVGIFKIIQATGRGDLEKGKERLSEAFHGTLGALETILTYRFPFDFGSSNSNSKSSSSRKASRHWVIRDPITNKFPDPGLSIKEFDALATSLMKDVIRKGEPGYSAILGVDDAVRYGYKYPTLDGIVDIHMHGSELSELFGGKFNAGNIHYNVDNLASFINTNYPDIAGVRVFSCYGKQCGAQELANKLGKPVLSSDHRIYAHDWGGMEMTRGTLHRFDPK